MAELPKKPIPPTPFLLALIGKEGGPKSQHVAPELMHLKIWDHQDYPETSASAEAARSSLNDPSVLEGKAEASPLKVTHAPSRSASASALAH